jgi:hypothetical protein
MYVIPRGHTAGETILPKDQHEVHPIPEGFAQGSALGSLPRCTLPYRMPLQSRNQALLPGSWDGTMERLSPTIQNVQHLLFKNLVLFTNFTVSLDSNQFAFMLSISSRHTALLMVRN